MIDITELLEILSKQKENLENFLKAAQLKQQSLVENDHDAFDEAVKSEEKYLSLLNQAERERELVLLKLFNRKLNPNEKKLDTLVELLGNQISDEEKFIFSNLQVEIKNVANKITLVNSQNLFLIKNARQFLIETVNTLIKDKRKSIVDRKV